MVFIFLIISIGSRTLERITINTWEEVFSGLYTGISNKVLICSGDAFLNKKLWDNALVCIFIEVFYIDDGVTEVIRLGIENDKFKVLDWSFIYMQLVFWVAIIGFFFLNLISYTSDQVVIQEYLMVKTEQDTAKSLRTTGQITLPGILIFILGL